jgi:hypothetical protein
LACEEVESWGFSTNYYDYMLQKKPIWKDIPISQTFPSNPWRQLQVFGATQVPPFRQVSLQVAEIEQNKFLNLVQANVGW